MNNPAGYAEQVRNRWQRIRKRPSRYIQPFVRSLVAALHSRPNSTFRVVARTLTKKGFRGKINNHSLSRTTPVKLTATKDYIHLPPTEDGESPEWLSFNHIPRRGLIYPERLHIEHPIAFELILPGPTTVPLARVLEEYSKLVPAFRDLVSVSYLWCHSLDMKEISPTCLALLFVSFLQV